MYHSTLGLRVIKKKKERNHAAHGGDEVEEEGLGFGVCGLGFRVQGAGFRVWGLGFRVEVYPVPSTRRTPDAFGASDESA